MKKCLLECDYHRVIRAIYVENATTVGQEPAPGPDGTPDPGAATTPDPGETTTPDDNPAGRIVTNTGENVNSTKGAVPGGGPSSSKKSNK